VAVEYMAVEIAPLNHSLRLARRDAVRWLFCGVYGSPSFALWYSIVFHGGSLVAEISHRLDISVGNRALVKDGHAGNENRYLLRYGATWEVDMRAKLRVGDDKGIICVTEYVDHIIAQGDRIFAGTEAEGKWFIFHDSLNIWTSKDTQQYLALQGFARRQVIAYGDTNAGTIYAHKNPGNSPEMSGSTMWR
jgi:hypothetical protein